MKVSGQWKWFFLFLATAGIVAAVLPVFFSRERQLSPGELARARDLWAMQGPGDYTLLVRWKKQVLPREGERTGPSMVRLKLRFRDGRMVEASQDGNFAPVEKFTEWTSDGIFRKLQAYLNRSKPKDFLVVDFASTDGHPRHWVWVTRQDPDPCREEVDLVLTPSPGGSQRTTSAGNDPAIPERKGG